MLLMLRLVRLLLQALEDVDLNERLSVQFLDT